MHTGDGSISSTTSRNDASLRSAGSPFDFAQGKQQGISNNQVNDNGIGSTANKVQFSHFTPFSVSLAVGVAVIKQKVFAVL